MSKTRKMAFICMVAAVYTVVSLVLAPISYGNIQCRISESLNLLPILYAPSAYGVILGCFLTNLFGVLNGSNPLGMIDCIVGTMATAIAVYGVLKFKNVRFKSLPILSALMPVIANGIIIGIELGVVFFVGNEVLGSIISGIEVAVGEAISMIIGLLLIKALENKRLFKDLAN